MIDTWEGTHTIVEHHRFRRRRRYTNILTPNLVWGHWGRTEHGGQWVLLVTSQHPIQFQMAILRTITWIALEALLDNNVLKWSIHSISIILCYWAISRVDEMRIEYLDQSAFNRYGSFRFISRTIESEPVDQVRPWLSCKMQIRRVASFWINSNRTGWIKNRSNFFHVDHSSIQAQSTNYHRSTRLDAFTLPVPSCFSHTSGHPRIQFAIANQKNKRHHSRWSTGTKVMQWQKLNLT